MPEPDIAQAKQQCIFCQIASGAVASKKVYEDEKVLGILDINPANPGHILLLPKEHYAFMPQIPEDMVAHLGMVAKQLSQALLRSLKATGTNIFVANGGAAGQRALHFMLHVIPRAEGDKVIGLDIPQSQLKPEDLIAVRQKLAPGIKAALNFEIQGAQAEAKKEAPREAEKEKEVQQFSGKEVQKSRDEETKKNPPAEQKAPEQKPQLAPKLNLDDIADFLGGKK